MPSSLRRRILFVGRRAIKFVTNGTMEFAVQPPPAADTWQQSAGERRYCSQDTVGNRDGMPVRNRVKMDRVSSWLADCAQSRAAPPAMRDEPRSRRRQQQQHHQQQDQSAEHDCDWETEELLLRVLVARPRFHKIPTAEEVRLFARQLRAYHARLWTLDQTRGYFRARRPDHPRPELAFAVTQYPEDIDDVDDDEEMTRWERAEEAEEQHRGHALSEEENDDSDDSVATPRGPIVGRKISPVEEELRDEMIRGYWILRRKKANMRLRTASITRDFGQKSETLPYRLQNAAY